MNTDPPEGDDLQRMLVSMKQNVLERATPSPKRRRGRSGVVIGVVALLAVGTATGAVALTLSQQDTPAAAPTQTRAPEPSPTATTPSSAPITQTPIPKVTSTPTPTATSLPVSDRRIPGSCYFLVPLDDNTKFFGAAKNTEFVLDEDGAHESTPQERVDGLVDPKASLSCSWQNEGVVAHISVSVERTTPVYAQDTENSALASGGGCDARLGGRVCQSEFVAQAETLPTTETTFLREDILITIQQTDYPTDGLLPAIVGEIWGD